jgi:hypothetical protein
MHVKNWMFLPAVLLWMACASQLRRPTAADAKRAAEAWPGYALDRLREGHRQYILKCSSCHPLHRPGEYSPAQWARVFPEMREKAHLDSSQSDLILKYLTIMSVVPAPAAEPR